MRKPKNYWTVETTGQEALKYSSRRKFKLGSNPAYQAALKGGWLDEICTHMCSPQKPYGYWDFLRVHLEAMKYSTRNDFRTRSLSAYKVACDKGWLDTVCSHMSPQGHMKRRLVYRVADDVRRVVYVGLTYSICRRQAQHRTQSKSLIENFGTDFILEPISKLLDLGDAARLESETIDHYRLIGYRVLNVAKGGSVGGNFTKWTEEKIRKEALKYFSRKDFGNGSKGAYAAALEMGILDEVCSHMPRLRMPDNHWTFETIHEQALKYKTRNAFAQGCKRAYFQAGKLGILDEVCSHMPKRAPKSR